MFRFEWNYIDGFFQSEKPVVRLAVLIRVLLTNRTI